MLSRVLAVVVCLVCASERAARPCSILSEPSSGSLPPPGATVGPLPLLSSIGAGFLSASTTPEIEIPLERDTTFSEIHGQQSGRIELWRPAQALPSGTYTWMSSLGAEPVTFFVDAELEPDAPPMREVTLRVTLTEPEEDQGGCSFGGSDSSCDDIDFTRLDVELGPASDLRDAPTVFVLEVTPDGGEPHRDLVDARFIDAMGRARIGMNDGHDVLPSFKSRRFCLALTPISDEGVIGARQDLGCFDPDDDDPRVTDDRGCAGAGSALNPVLWLAALLVATRRERG